jgi:hypothetical protein
MQSNEVEEIWPDIREAFAHYGRKLSPVCGPSRRKLLIKRFEEGYDRDAILAAIHGYVRFHGGLDPDAGETFNPRKWFDPEAVFKETRFDTRVELGYEGRWVAFDPKQYHDDQVKAKQAAAQKRLNAARAANVPKVVDLFAEVRVVDRGK